MDQEKQPRKKYRLKGTASKVVVRSYKLKLYGNKAKTDTVRYAIMRHNQYANMFMGRVFFGQSKISTKGLGTLASHAAHDAFQIVKKQKASARLTGCKTNVPFVRRLGCRARRFISKDSSFDYWFKVSNQFQRIGSVSLPAKSHKALNMALKNGWKLTKMSRCIISNSGLYAVVYVSKKQPMVKKPRVFIGVDVGYKYSVCTSLGHIGRNITKVLRRTKQIRSSRRRSGFKRRSDKTAIKQVLDREANKLIGRSKKLNACVVVEDPKKLAPLTGRNLHGWACSYVAKRLEILGAEEGIMILSVSPYQTSIQCSKCGIIEKQHRVSRDGFECKCGYKDHADLNAAKNIARKGFLKLSETATLKRGKSCK